MPQLNPAPWLWTLIITWTILLTIMVPKTALINHVSSPENTPLMYHTQPWVWPWT